MGLLTGKYTRNDQNEFNQFTPDQYTSIMDALDTVKEIAGKHNATVAQIILAWYITDPDISVVIPGARVADQVHSNAKALGIELSGYEFDQINHLFDQF